MVIELHPARERGPGRSGLFDHSPESLEALVASWGFPAYRARQVLEWAYRHQANAYSGMTNVPRGLREKLAVHAPIYESQLVKKQESEDGTVKLAGRVGGRGHQRVRADPGG